VNLSKLLSTKPNEEADNNQIFTVPARKWQARRSLYVMVESAAIVTAWAELFWRHCL
jgi:hypothetical protein